MLNDAVESALNEGFTRLRTCGDMSRLLIECDAREHARDYEALLNQFFRDTRIFRADHPFLFAIRDRRNGAILFLGRMSDPPRAS